MKKRWFFTILGLAIVFGAIFGYQAFVAYKIEQAMSNRPPPVETVTATHAKLLEWQPKLTAVGTLSAVQGIMITAQTSGEVVEIAVESGARVEEGQLLVRIDASVAQAELRGLQAQARLAQLELQRQRRLLERNAVSQASVDVAESKLEQARARVAAQQARLADKTIEAPFPGQLGIFRVDPGEFVTVGEPIVTLQSLAPINVDFAVPQQELGPLREGLLVKASLEAFGPTAFTGPIIAISPKVNPATRSASVRARLPNDERLLRPGMFVDVTVRLPGERKVVTLPQTAITYNPYGDSVFLIREERTDQGETILRAYRKLVETGETRGDLVQIIEGVEPGDRVVTSGQLKLHNGSIVKINNTVTPTSDPTPELGTH